MVPCPAVRTHAAEGLNVNVDFLEVASLLTQAAQGPFHPLLKDNGETGQDGEKQPGSNGEERHHRPCLDHLSRGI